MTLYNFYFRRNQSLKKLWNSFSSVSGLIFKLLVPVVSVVLLSGCFRYYYKAVSPPVKPDTLNILATTGKTFVVHSGNSVFYLSDFMVQGDSAFGKMTGNYQYPSQVAGFPNPNSIARYRPKYGDYRLLNEIHLYVNAFKQTLVPGYYTAAFALRDLWRLDIYEKDTGSTNASVILGVLGILAGIVLAIPAAIFLLAITIGSCPLIYINTGSGFELAGELYSGAVYAPLERHDYLALPGLIEENNAFTIKMANEAREIENTNLAELFVVDHPAGTEVLYDKYGNYQTFEGQSAPACATNFNGTDIMSFISKKDNLCYFGDIRDNNLPLTDGVIMSFSLPEGANEGKLLIRARNSKWLDYVYKNSHELFGSYYSNWVKKQNKSETGNLIRWSLDQKIPLSVYVERNGQWEFNDYFNNAGPACLRDDVLAIDLRGLDSDTVRIKLEAGAFFWEIDYAAMDFSPNMPVSLALVPVSKAITNKEADVAGMLKYDDLKYYSQADIGDEAELEFASPPIKGEKRSVFLHSKGYYQILSDARGLPKTGQLKELRQPMKFPEFSRKLMNERIGEILGKNE